MKPATSFRRPPRGMISSAAPSWSDTSRERAGGTDGSSSQAKQRPIRPYRAPMPARSNGVAKNEGLIGS